MDLSEMRRHYRLSSLRRKDLCPNPTDQFTLWFEEAKRNHLPEPNAFILATATQDGRPSCRTVLMKYYTNETLLFFTSYESQKSQDLEQNPQAAGLFVWIEMERQIRFEGTVVKISREESESYFSKRPRGSQIGAWSSSQSSVIESREVLEQAAAHYTKLFEGKEIPCPPFWGGFRIFIKQWEFWQGREDRLHDRFQYSKTEGKWAIERLAP